MNSILSMDYTGGSNAKFGKEARHSDQYDRVRYGDRPQRYLPTK